MFNIEQDEQRLAKIEQDYEKFMSYIEADERSEDLKKMYEVFKDELTLAPASAKTHYHNAFPGGYLDHVLRVTDCALKMASMYKAQGGDINFTKQELVFAALHHDLGKLGTEDGPYYLELDMPDDKWRLKKGEVYKHNENIQPMNVTDRGLMLLQKYGIKVTQTEWLSIKLSDGLYDESNKTYLISYRPYPIRTNLVRIIHWADHMACCIENDQTRFTM